MISFFLVVGWANPRHYRLTVLIRGRGRVCAELTRIRRHRVRDKHGAKVVLLNLSHNLDCCILCSPKK